MQFPRWMNGHTDDDRKAILDQMRKIIEDEGHVFLPADPDWRELVYGNWAGLGGNRAELKAIFDEADATMG
jgi:hypothetical protein